MPNPFNKKKGSNASTPFSSTPSIPDLFNEDDGPMNRDEQNVGQEVPSMDETGWNEPDASDLNPDTDKNLQKYKDFTNNHPAGKLWLQLLNGQTQVHEKLGLASMPISVDDMCTYFYNWQLSEKNKIQRKIKQGAAEMEEALLEREFNAHLLNQAVEAPKDFSKTPTLKDSRARGDCLRLLPTGSNKFSGDPRGMPILEYLHTLKAMQKACNLSREEFLEMMRYSTTGRAHLLLLRMMDHGKSIESIFHIFLSHYDKRIQPEAARTQLMAYRIPKSSDFAKAEAHIEELATRVVSNMPAGVTREAAYNAEIITALTRSLPPQSSILVINTNNELAAKLGSNPTADQLSRKLNMYRHAIDMDIKANGANGEGRSADRKSTQNRNNSKGKKFTSYSVTRNETTVPSSPVQNTSSEAQSHHNIWQVQAGQPTNNNMKRPFVKRMDKKGPRKPWQDRQNTNMSANRTPQAPSRGNNEARGNFRGRGNFQKRGVSNSQNQANRNYCSLCGKTDHRAAQGCPNMVDSNGRTVSIMPCKDTCPACPPHVNPRLSHPSYLCPYKNGKFSS